MTSRRIVVLTAGLTQPSSTRLLADQLGSATRAALHERGVEADVSVIEVRDHAHEVVNNLLTGFAPGGLVPALDAVAGADGLIAVTPTFNASYSGLFKAFFDVLPDQALAGKPVLIGATGGTARHSLVLEHALRPMMAYLRAAVLPTAVFAASEDWGTGDLSNERGPANGLRRRIDRAAAELAVAVAANEPTTLVDPFALTTTFEDLMSGSD